MVPGNKIFEKIQLDRDFTGSEADTYSQLLQTMLSELTANGHEKEFFTLLEKAEKENKKLVLINEPKSFTTENEVFLENIKLVKIDPLLIA